MEEKKKKVKEERNQKEKKKEKAKSKAKEKEECFTEKSLQKKQKKNEIEGEGLKFESQGISSLVSPGSAPNFLRGAHLAGSAPPRSNFAPPDGVPQRRTSVKRTEEQLVRVRMFGKDSLKTAIDLLLSSENLLLATTKCEQAGRTEFFSHFCGICRDCGLIDRAVSGLFPSFFPQFSFQLISVFLKQWQKWNSEIQTTSDSCFERTPLAPNFFVNTI